MVALEFNRQLKWQISCTRFIVLVTLINATLYNLPLYLFALDNLDYFSFNGILTLLTLFVLSFFITGVILSLLAMLTQHLVKPFCMLMALGNSIALYFVITYQAILDKTMMGNVQNTNFMEATELFHPKLIGYLIIFGILPCFLLTKIRIVKARRLRLLFFAFITVLLSLGWIYLASSSWLWIDKNAKKLGGMIMPWSYVVNTVRYQAVQSKRSEKQTLLPPITSIADDKTVVVLVIGEAARAQNFSLYGYDRSTNPLLAEADVIVLKNPVACSTYTTASISCILSHGNGSSIFSEQYEVLPSYLQRHGIDVIWRTNNWGEPKVQVQDYQRGKNLKADCKGQGCGYDEVLLTGLTERILSSKQQKIFIVLHQTGSHGPSYYTKYPKQFEVFKPVCKSVELDQCTQQELLNAYDNTILYTDYFLAQTIGVLKDLEMATMLMYISDHGESLGEYGLYLHGTPYSVAPEVQKNYLEQRVTIERKKAATLIKF